MPSLHHTARPQSTTAEDQLAQIKLPVAAALTQVEQHLAQRLSTAAPPVRRAYTHILQGGGKRLRPLLVLLAAQSVGEAGPQAVQLAAMVEEVHIASMLHDDVVDRSQVRRGQASVQALWDNRIAVLTGDYVAADVYQLLSSDEYGQAPEILAQAIAKMCSAEAQELTMADSLRTEDQYYEIIAGKTAALMAAAAALGGHAGGGSPEQINALESYGYHLGIAFQIRDDSLDLYGTPSELGKPIGKDLQAGQWTLPIIYACRQPGGDELHAQLCELGPDSPAQTIHQIATLTAELGGQDYAAEKSADFARQAITAIEELPPSPAHSALIELAEFVSKRGW